jgi:ring-1,2-phenylacetyl-CoA epoxidase subunit PaaD
MMAVDGMQSDDARVSHVLRLLEAVKDPEIPDVSVVELGMIASVAIEAGVVIVEMTPTFTACPAIAMIQAGIASAVRAGGFDDVDVRIVYDPPWTTDRITEVGLKKLKAFGLAVPGKMCGRSVEPKDLVSVACPFCDSTDTVLESAFGPTLCRAIHYCDTCHQSFEQMKPVT